jgi:trehalose-6-phosphatase
MKTLINVSNRLPVTIGKTIEKSSGGLVYAMEGLGHHYDSKWIGWAGGIVNDPSERKRIAAELFEMLSNLSVEIHHEKKIVEVSSNQINKGVVLEHFMFVNPYDGVLCAGDDETDESMFRIREDKIIDIYVGNNPKTTAKFRIPNPKAFRNFLMRCLEKLSPEHNLAEVKVAP